MPKWLLHNCHCHRPQEIPSENFQASLCPPIVPSARRRLETYDSSPWNNSKYLMLRCLQWWHDWCVLSVSWPQLAGVHPWSPSLSTSQPQPMSSAAKKQAQTSTCKTDVGWYFLGLSWFYSHSFIIFHFVTNLRELQWCLVTALAWTGLDPAPLCCDQADGWAQSAAPIISRLRRNHCDS